MLRSSARCASASTDDGSATASPRLAAVRSAPSESTSFVISAVFAASRSASNDSRSLSAAATPSRKLTASWISKSFVTLPFETPRPYSTGRGEESLELSRAALLLLERERSRPESVEQPVDLRARGSVPGVVAGERAGSEGGERRLCLSGLDRSSLLLVARPRGCRSSRQRARPRPPASRRTRPSSHRLPESAQP